ncbi:hypothetical protein CLAIMM_03533 [Cladophialophora immunda]|nr:hypothetical protein CLAIMM_03533 [Cladophialophora immunda]
MAGRRGIEYGIERTRRLKHFKDVPLELPYKVEKVLGYETDRVRFSRGAGSSSIWPCWQWDNGAPSGDVMSMDTSLPKLPAEPKSYFGSAGWTFPESLMSNDAVPTTIYSDLPDNSWFRLLLLQPSQDMWTPIQCQLRPFKRSSVRHKYETLSYAWKEGDPKYEWEIQRQEEKDKWRPTLITCNGHQVPIKENLGSALIHLRHSSRARAVWVDALCINQSDEAEAVGQIQAMKEIYNEGYRTVVWLGRMPERLETISSDPLSLGYPEAAIASICHIVKHWDPSQPVEYFVTDPATRSVATKKPNRKCSFARKLDEYFTKPRNPYVRDLQPLEHLFEVRWFSRKWVIQEIALSRSVDVLFHNCRISWHWIGLAAAVMRTRWDSALRDYRLYNVYNAYLMFRLSQSHKLDPSKMSFVELLRLTAGFKTSQPKDVFFALLGLETRDHHPDHQPLLKADHPMSYEDICIHFARSFLEAARSTPSPLAILLDAGIHAPVKPRVPGDFSEIDPDEQTTKAGKSLPSWVPSWKPGRPSLLSPWSLDHHFEASRGLDCYFAVSSSNRLTVQGISISTVLWSGLVTMVSENDIASGIDWLSRFSFTQPIQHAHLEVYSRTLCAGRDSYGRREHDSAAMVLPFVAFASYGVIPDTSSYPWINACRQCLPMVQQDPWNRGEASSTGRWRHGTGEWDPEWIAGRELFGQVAGVAARGRRLFLTAAGHIGLGPGETRVGDSVCIVGGSSMPLILRPRNGEDSTFVGPCYVDDIMDGEAVSAAESGELHFGPLWSDSFRQTAEQVEAYSAISKLQIQQMVIC